MKCEVMGCGEFLIRGHVVGVSSLGLTRPGSDFSQKMVSWLMRRSVPSESDGQIAVVHDGDKLVGWARTERWLFSGEAMYDTLEAFVDSNYRMRGVASFAVCGLVSSALHDSGGIVAVFHPHMLLVARRCGLRPVLFHKGGDGKWTRA